MAVATSLHNMPPPSTRSRTVNSDHTTLGQDQMASDDESGAVADVLASQETPRHSSAAASNAEQARTPRADNLGDSIKRGLMGLLGAPSDSSPAEGGQGPSSSRTPPATLDDGSCAEHEISKEGRRAANEWDDGP